MQKHYDVEVVGKALVVREVGPEGSPDKTVAAGTPADCAQAMKMQFKLMLQGR